MADFEGIKNPYKIEWGVFSLVEFIVSERNNLGTGYKKALDIGSGQGVHSKILTAAGLEVSKLDMYSDDVEYKVDFIKHNFEEKFDVIFCSHVIEHQRNVGNFLDKIFDIMSDNAVLILTAPKHKAENLIEGHLNCFFTSYFCQHLIHAGFDMKKGKYLSCGGIENSAIVSKARNFNLSERDENGYIWTEKHKERCFFPLENAEISKLSFFHNSIIFSSKGENNISITLPDNYQKLGIIIEANRWNFRIEI